MASFKTTLKLVIINVLENIEDEYIWCDYVAQRLCYIPVYLLIDHSWGVP